ncbi:unnamed protein product [Schistocephalus solidus]|uniref:Uncharacterized protein n=1 Tax=Schistocephalus solidus TaxID=70667 RepID=A0A183SI48_SCHSO|nr:unnamed protein product [Schistocephalus solidus]
MVIRRVPLSAEFGGDTSSIGRAGVVGADWTCSSGGRGGGGGEGGGGGGSSEGGGDVLSRGSCGDCGDLGDGSLEEKPWEMDFSV